MATYRRPSLVTFRKLAFHKQSGRCFYCLQPMWLGDVQIFAQQHHLTLKQAKLLQCTGEHLTPHKHGGSGSPENIVAACHLCNHRRHDHGREIAPSDYRSLVAKRMAKGGWHPARVV